MAKKNLTREEVLHLAKLANITLSDEEVFVYGKQLNEILGYIDQLNQVNTETISVTSHSSGTINVSEDDKIDTSRTLHNLAKYFKVAKVL